MTALVDGVLGDSHFVNESGARQVDAKPLHVVAKAPRWSHVLRVRLAHGPHLPRDDGQSRRLAVRVTAQVLSGRLGALCVTNEFDKALGGAVEWRRQDGVLTLDVPLYASVDQAWLVFRTTSRVPDEELEFRIFDMRAVIHEAEPRALVDAGPLESELNGPRVVIYTAVTNGYDTLLPPQTIEPGCDYICYTDDPAFRPPKPWQVRPIRRGGRDPRMVAKWYKVHPHLLFPSCDVSVWIDGRVRLTGGVRPLVSEVLAQADFGVFENPWVDCVYLQAEEAIEEGRDSGPLIEQQIRRYATAGFPPHKFSVCGGVMIRRHHQRDVVRTMRSWWHEMATGSAQDQLSLGYVLWKQRLEFHLIRRLIFDNPLFEIGQHNFVDRYLPD